MRRLVVILVVILAVVMVFVVANYVTEDWSAHHVPGGAVTVCHRTVSAGYAVTVEPDGKLGSVALPPGSTGIEDYVCPAHLAWWQTSPGEPW